MTPLFARYPFLVAAREAVEATGVDLGQLVANDDGPIVRRAVERVDEALEDGIVGDPHRSARVELLSYPVARVLVSIVDAPVLTAKYARAESARAYDYFTNEIDSTTELKSVRVERISLERLLAEFDLGGHVTEDDGKYLLEVGTFLELASGKRGSEWRLVNRPLSNGTVPVSTGELHSLLEEAIRERVAEGLPLSVPAEIEDALAEEVEYIETRLAELALTREIDTVVPELFPPCMKALLDSIQKGENLPHHSRFAITSFLTSIGMSTDEIVDLYLVSSAFGEEMTRYQTDHIRGETSATSYSPPSCATMQSYGDCVNMDDLCERISHPLAYYERRLDDADEDEFTDWRETRAANAE